jgi:hypothetical protein
MTLPVWKNLIDMAGCGDERDVLAAARTIKVMFIECKEHRPMAMENGFERQYRLI